MFMKIDSIAKLELNIRMFKKKAAKEGIHFPHVYPIYCEYYNKNKSKFLLPKEEVLNKACDILVEEADG